MLTSKLSSVMLTSTGTSELTTTSTCFVPASGSDGSGDAVADEVGDDVASDGVEGDGVVRSLEVTFEQSNLNESRMCCTASRCASSETLMSNTATHSRPSGAATTA